MGCAVFAFVFLFAVPMATLIAVGSPAQQIHVAEMTGLAALVFVIALLLPSVRRRLRFQRVRRPVPGMLDRLDWPADLTQTELEAHCAAWLRAQGWVVTMATDADPTAAAVYIMAARGATTVGMMCDRAGETLNPAIIRVF